MDQNIQNLVEMYNQYGENENRFIEHKVIDLSKGYIDHLTSRYITKEYYEDLRQELTIALVLSIRKYNKNSKAKFETYAYKAMNNTLIRKLRYQRLIRIPEYLKWEDHVVPTMSNILSKDDKVIDLYSYKPDNDKYKANMKSLSDREKSTLILRYSGYSYKEISEKFKCSQETVRNYFKRATQKIEGEMI